MNQRNRIHDFIKSQLVETVDGEKTTVVFGSNLSIMSGTNGTNCKNDEADSCAYNASSCKNSGVCSGSTNYGSCSNLEKPNLNETAGCGKNQTTCVVNVICK